jgi:hypothetical protein
MIKVKVIDMLITLIWSLPNVYIDQNIKFYLIKIHIIYINQRYKMQERKNSLPRLADRDERKRVSHIERQRRGTLSTESSQNVL